MKGVLKFNGLSIRVLLSLVFVFSCKDNNRKPDNLLSRDEMVRVLTQVYINEEKVSRLGLAPDSGAELFSRVEGRMFEKLGVPDSVFRESVDYYTDHPAELEMIYSVLVDSLQLLEQRTFQKAYGAQEK